MTLTFVVPADVEAPTGGNRYDTALFAALRRLGTDVQLRRAAGRWPVASAVDRSRLVPLLGTGVVLVDGLVAAGAPEAIEEAVGAGASVHVLVHLPLALETGLSPARQQELDTLERRALHAATGVVATSRWAADHLTARHGLTRVAVAAPGVDAAELAHGSTPARLLQLASVTPRKDQLGVVEALHAVRDLQWSAGLVGSLAADPSYVAQVRAAIAAYGLAERVQMYGPLAGQELQQQWDATDLLLLPSLVETFGMVVTEALARGIPAVVGRGTGAQEALGGVADGSVPGAVVPVGDPAALAAAVRRWLTDPVQRRRSATAATLRRATLPRWDDTARDVLAALAVDVPPAATRSTDAEASRGKDIERETA